MAALRIGVACEDGVDFEVVTRLFDRFACEIDGITPALLDSSRSFEGWDGRPSWSKVTSAYKAWRGLKPRDRRLHGKWNGLDARVLRATMLLFEAQTPAPDAVIVVRDRDGRPERLLSMANLERSERFPTALGSPQPEVEAWLVRGFQPENRAEVDRLDAIKRELEFDPTEHPDRLHSTVQGPRDAKRVLQTLTGDELARRHRCGDALPERPHAESGLLQMLEDCRALVLAVFLRDRAG